MTWKTDDTWKVVFPEEKVFLMKHHNWAFVAWDIARDKGWIKNNSNLFHVDQHLDAAIDGAAVPGLLQASGLKELSSLTKSLYGNDQYVGTDNFIWAGFARETIKTIVYVSPEEADDLLDIDSHYLYLQNHLSRNRIEELNVYRWESMESFEVAKQFKLMRSLDDNSSFILDLDLDFFAVQSENEYGHTCYVLKDIAEIRSDLIFLKQIYKWDLITVALSPEDWHIGGPDNAQTVLEVFLDVFQLDLSRAQDWSVLEEPKL
ncbi:TPA: UPF0489 family protein [Salmonella enterica subsp. enterica serovar Typhi str. AG3]|nr:UPF0489 family protein [Salmonella enterica subsp. enterica serovar Typhi str. AG3]